MPVHAPGYTELIWRCKLVTSNFIQLSSEFQNSADKHKANSKLFPWEISLETALHVPVQGARQAWALGKKVCVGLGGVSYSLPRKWGRRDQLASLWLKWMNILLEDVLCIFCIVAFQSKYVLLNRMTCIVNLLDLGWQTGKKKQVQDGTVAGMFVMCQGTQAQSPTV